MSSWASPRRSDHALHFSIGGVNELGMHKRVDCQVRAFTEQSGQSLLEVMLSTPSLCILDIHRRSVQRCFVP